MGKNWIYWTTNNFNVDSVTEGNDLCWTNKGAVNDNIYVLFVMIQFKITCMQLMKLLIPVTLRTMLTTIAVAIVERWLIWVAKHNKLLVKE